MWKEFLLKVDVQNKMVPQLWQQWSCEQLKKHATDKYFAKKSQTLNPNQLTLQEKHAIITIVEWQKFWRILWSFGYSGSLATLSALQRFGFSWTTAAKATHSQELAGHFRPRLSPDNQNRAFTKKKGSYIKILETALLLC